MKVGGMLGGAHPTYDQVAALQSRVPIFRTVETDTSPILCFPTTPSCKIGIAVHHTLLPLSHQE